MKETLIDVIREIPCPREKKDDRGRPPVHSKQKLDFACLMMMADNNTYRGIKSDLQDMQTPWSNEPIPDHTWLSEYSGVTDFKVRFVALMSSHIEEAGIDDVRIFVKP